MHAKWEPSGYVIGQEILSLKLSKDLNKRNKAENKGKGKRNVLLNDKDVF